MDYQDLFKRVRDGNASPEERQVVQQELDKFLAIEEHLADELDRELQVDPSTTEKQRTETKAITSVVNRRLGRVVLTSVLAIVLLYLIVFVGVSKLMDRAYYNPSDQLSLDLTALTDMNFPGYRSVSTFSNSNGFSEHTISYSLIDTFTQHTTPYAITIKRGIQHLEGPLFEGLNSNSLLFNLWNGFSHIKFPATDSLAQEAQESQLDHINQKTSEYLAELNPSSYISMSLSFKNDLDLEQIYQMIDDYPELTFDWIGLRTIPKGTLDEERQINHLIGFTPNQDSHSNVPIPEEYPMFYMSQLTDYPEIYHQGFVPAYAKAAEMHVESRLRYLIDRPDFVSTFDYSSVKTDYYKDSLAYIQEHGTKSFGVLVYGTAEDFQHILPEIDYELAYINEALPLMPDRLLYQMNQ